MRRKTQERGRGGGNPGRKKKEQTDGETRKERAGEEGDAKRERETERGGRERARAQTEGERDKSVAREVRECHAGRGGLICERTTNISPFPTPTERKVSGKR